MEQNEGNSNMHKENINKWKRDLSFCIDEVKILNRYLADVDIKSKSSDMIEDIAHFQSRLSTANHKAAELMLEVNAYEKEYSALIDQDHITETHTILKNKVIGFCHSYTGLKSSFVRFLAKSEIVI